MTIFNFLNSIFYSKKKIELDCDSEKQFNVFMINRWMSMYSAELIEIINNTSNRFGHIFETKQEQYDWLYYLFPRLRFKKVAYIKKKKKDGEETKDQDDLIKHMAQSHEMSQREVRQMIDLFS